MAAGTLLLALICLALVIDTGRLYYEQRKLQRVVDDAALETAAQSGMCGSQSAGQVQAYAASSAAGNGFTPGRGDSLVATLGTVQFDSGYAGAQSRRVFSAGGDLADSVQVQATHTVPSSLILNVASLFSGASANTTLGAHAVARRTAMAGLSAGTSLASLDDQQAGLLNNLLNALLGSHLALNAVGYRGLANANVSLLGLSDRMRALGVNVAAGSVDSLLGAQASLAQLLGATVNAIDPTQVANVNTGLLGQQLLGAGVQTATVTLGSVLSVVAPDSVRNEALQSSVNVLDLITALAFVANRQHAVDLDTGVNLGGLGLVHVKLWIVEPPQIAFGYPGKDGNGQWRTQVRTAAIRTNVTGGVTLPGVLSINLGLALDVAQGMAALDTIACGGVGRPVDVSVYAQPGIAQLHLGTFRDGQSATVDPISVKIVGGLVGADVSAATVVGNASGTSLSYRISSPKDLPSEPQTASSSVSQSLDNAIGTLSSSINVTPTGLLSALTLLGLNPSSLISTILGVLRPALTALADVVLDPLLQLLGISLGTIDVRLIDLQTGGAEMLI